MERMDFSMFEAADVANIALQRTRHLKRWPFIGCPSYNAWLRGDPGPLHREARYRREQIMTGAMADISREFRVIANYLGDRKIGRMVDIGCGQGLVDILFWRKYGCHVHLVDIEHTEAMHHDYRESGAGYASLASARRFLESNDVPSSCITTTNPNHGELEDSEVDLVVSMISAGSHYPISAYADWALRVLKPGGILMFDARDHSDQEEQLSGFSSVEVVEKGLKHTKLAAFK